MPGDERPPAARDERGRVLIIEDDSLTRQLISAHVERLGLAPVEVPPSVVGVRSAIASAGPADVVILDIILGPDIDGFEVIRMLGKIEFRGRLVVVSGFGPDYLQTLGALAGALAIQVAGILEKPIRPIDLERCLRHRPAPG